jgi:hypothetical protein
MKSRWPLLAFSLFCLAPPLAAAPPLAPDAPAEKVELKTYHVPYRLTDTQHVLVRLKINGKGPFNFIVDTGAPLLYVSIPAAKQIGLDVKEKGPVTLERVEVEGGPVHAKFKAVIETPYQLKGMNALGMAGAELHGIIGYTLLSHYRMEIDFTRDKMAWTRLDYKPPQPVPLGIKADKSMSALGAFMEALALLMGKKTPPTPTPRGFLGVELEEEDGDVLVKAVLPRGPAAAAGLKAGDRIREVQGKQASTISSVLRHAAEVTAGQAVRLTILRGEERQEIKITAGEGL